MQTEVSTSRYKEEWQIQEIVAEHCKTPEKRKDQLFRRRRTLRHVPITILTEETWDYSEVYWILVPQVKTVNVSSGYHAPQKFYSLLAL